MGILVLSRVAKIPLHTITFLPQAILQRVAIPFPAIIVHPLVILAPPILLLYELELILLLTRFIKLLQDHNKNAANNLAAFLFGIPMKLLLEIK